jgi:hypothetical protein
VADAETVEEHALLVLERIRGERIACLHRESVGREHAADEHVPGDEGDRRDLEEQHGELRELAAAEERGLVSSARENEASEEARTTLKRRRYPPRARFPRRRRSAPIERLAS